ncbi:MAG TPA: hypothetical protein HA348_02500 [Thermoplasmata archaeon]|nr:hypothetical protein [Thermoplasmata archaeon]
MGLSKPNIKELRKKLDVEGLIEALRYSDWRVRRDAAKALGNIQDGRAVEPLIKALKDEKAEVRRNVATALGMSFFGAALDPDERPWAFDEIRTKEIVELLIGVYIKDEDENVRVAAALAFAAIPVPHTLEEGEMVVRKVKGVEGIIGRGSLLLTNQRLIYHGYTLTESFSLDMPLTEIVNCEVKKPLFGKEKLSVTARRAVFKNLSKLVIEEVAIRGFSQPPASIVEPNPQEFKDIEQPETLKSEIMEQVEIYKKSLSQKKKR